jgi:AcrR family transcriptional regulator
VTERAKDLRERIVSAAAELLMEGGREAVSTRAVSAAAGVQAPAIYRQFADMQQLLHAAAREVLAGYVRHKGKQRASDDPLEELRRGWDVHVAFGLANPAAYALIYGDSTAQDAPEMDDGHAMLRAKVARLAEAGRLGVSVPHAARLFHAGACGVTLSLIAAAPNERDARLSHTMREAVLSAILTPAVAEPAPGRNRIAARAVALRAVLGEGQEAFSPAELLLLTEWLDRLAQS